MSQERFRARIDFLGAASVPVTARLATRQPHLIGVQVQDGAAVYVRVMLSPGSSITVTFVAANSPVELRCTRLTVPPETATITFWPVVFV